MNLQCRVQIVVDVSSLRISSILIIVGNQAVLDSTLRPRSKSHRCVRIAFLDDVLQIQEWQTCVNSLLPTLLQSRP